MKIDETDIRTFNAKQLTVDYMLPSTAVSVDMFDGALIPSEGETYTPLSGVTVRPEGIQRAVKPEATRPEEVQRNPAKQKIQNRRKVNNGSR